MKYSLQILKNRNLFKRHKYPSPNAWNIKMFLDPQLYKHWRFWVSLSYPILNFKKLVCPKSVRMRHSLCWFIFTSIIFVCFVWFLCFLLFASLLFQDRARGWVESIASKFIAMYFQIAQSSTTIPDSAFPRVSVQST